MITEEAARAYYVDADPAHGFEHVLRVWRLAERIGREEGADLEILRAAALLHDVAREEEARTGVCHAAAGAQRARRILAGQDPERVEAVAEAIAAHRFRGADRPRSLVARVLYDADKLDAIGAIGVARAYAVAGARGQRLWAPVDDAYAGRAPEEGGNDLGDGAHTPVHEYRFKLARLQDTLFTDAGRRIAAGRHRFLAAFFAELEREVRAEA